MGVGKLVGRKRGWKREEGRGRGRKESRAVKRQRVDGW